jgi:hypothetical protein
MGRKQRRKRRNLNGLHTEAVVPLSGGFNRLPPPTTPLQDMKILAGSRSIASLLNNTILRLGFL